MTNRAPEGPFYHGTRADLRPGDLLVAGRRSNYRPEIRMNHIYFTALEFPAALAAALAPGPGPARVYVVAPTGPFEDDPNVTDKRFPGNPTRSYRSRAPLRILGELEDWTRLTDAEIADWRARIAANDGGIINQARRAPRARGNPASPAPRTGRGRAAPGRPRWRGA